MAVDVYWIKELCQTDIFFFWMLFLIPGIQPISGLILAPRGYLAVSAGICSCHGLKVWLSRGQGISSHPRMLKGLSVLMLKHTGKSVFFMLREAL